DPRTNGFSPYGSLGYYAITGSVENAHLPDRFAIPENAPTGTVVGVVSGVNPYGGPLSFTITSGDTNKIFAIDSSGTLTVANATGTVFSNNPTNLLDYEALARNTQLPVQFELLVDIAHLGNQLMNELNHRVVVAVTNVNEPPQVT